MGSRSPRGKFGSYLDRAKKRAAAGDAGVAGGARGRARRRFADRMRRRSRRAPGRSSYQTRSRSPFAGRRGRER